MILKGQEQIKFLKKMNFSHLEKCKVMINRILSCLLVVAFIIFILCRDLEVIHQQDYVRNINVTDVTGGLVNLNP